MLATATDAWCSWPSEEPYEMRLRTVYLWRKRRSIHPLLSVAFVQGLYRCTEIMSYCWCLVLLCQRKSQKEVRYACMGSGWAALRLHLLKWRPAQKRSLQKQLEQELGWGGFAFGYSHLCVCPLAQNIKLLFTVYLLVFPTRLWAVFGIPVFSAPANILAGKGNL